MDDGWSVAPFEHMDEGWFGWACFTPWPSRAMGYSRWRTLAIVKSGWNSVVQSMAGTRYTRRRWYWWY